LAKSKLGDLKSTSVRTVSCGGGVAKSRSVSLELGCTACCAQTFADDARLKVNSALLEFAMTGCADTSSLLSELGAIDRAL